MGSPDSRSRSWCRKRIVRGTARGVIRGTGEGAAVVRSSVCVCVVSGLCGRSLP